MNTSIAVTDINERLDAPVHTEESIICQETEPTALLEEPHKRVSKKGSIRRRRSFKCSAKDFVPRRTDSFSDHYELGHLLGEGAFGEVYICYSKLNNAERAVKVIHKDRMLPSEYDEVVNEFQLLRKMDHPNVIRMYEFYDCEDKFYIVQELAKGEK